MPKYPFERIRMDAGMPHGQAMRLENQHELAGFPGDGITNTHAVTPQQIELQFCRLTGTDDGSTKRSQSRY